MKKKVMCIFGTRPEAIKMAPVVLGFKKYQAEFISIVVVTGQHREMLDQVLNLFEINPDYDLDVMSEEQTLKSVTIRILDRLDYILTVENPDLILVHGDTTTAFAAALAAFYKKIPIGHVEAGLRSFDIWNPYPEEFNRKAVDLVCSLHFAPTALAEKHLLCESVLPQSIFVTGNTGIDALKLCIEKIEKNFLKKISDLIIKIAETEFILITAHRRENFGQPLINFCYAIKKLALERKHLHFVYPVHMNPNVHNTVKNILSTIDNVHLFDPLDYPDFIYLIKHSLFVVTDSGGLQEEAPALGKPVLVLRNVTERPEAVEAGTVKVIGTDTEIIYWWMVQLLDNKELFFQMANSINPYGDGKATERTIEAIRYFYEMQSLRPTPFSGSDFKPDGLG